MQDELTNNWTEQQFSRGNYKSDHGWKVNRYHDERDNFYTAEKNGEMRREFRNNLEAALRWADAQI